LTPRGRGRGRGQAAGGVSGHPASSPRSPTQSPSPSRGRGQRGTALRSPRPERAPAGICDFYWADGTCRRGFDCKFSHQFPQNNSQPEQVTPIDSNDFDFFSIEGLSAHNRSSRTSAGSNMKPREVHNHIIPFLADNYTFRSAAYARSFVRILENVNTRNPHWVCAFSLASSGSVLICRSFRILKTPRYFTFSDLPAKTY
jgi:hypothetical protein